MREETEPAPAPTGEITPAPAEEMQPLPSSGDNVRASWNFSLSDVRSNMAHCNAEAKESLVAAFLWCIDRRHPVSRFEFAKKIGYDANTVYKVFTGKYTRPETRERLDVPPKMLLATREFLRLERERFLGGGKGEFVITPTSRKIWTACDLARESQTPVFLWGVSHIGKSWALENYTTANNHGRTVYIRMLAACGLGGMIRRINERLGNSDKCNTSDAIARVKRAITPNMLLILDELHLLVYTYRKESFFACLEVIREIHDETGCGMILCGTKLLLEKAGAAQHGELEQLFRRGVHKVHARHADQGRPGGHSGTLGSAFPGSQRRGDGAKHRREALRNPALDGEGRGPQSHH